LRVPRGWALSRSLTLRILALVWISFAATFVALIALNARELRATLLERGRLRASSIADLLEYSFESLLERGDYLSIQRCAENAATIEGVERVWVVGRDGSILAAGDPADVGRQVTGETDPTPDLLSGKEPERVWQEGSGPSAALHLVKPVRGGGIDPREPGELLAAIWVKLSLRPLYRHISSSIASLSLVSLLCAGVLSLLLGWVLSRTVARPLVDLSRATTEVARGRLDAEVPVRGRDEIGLLARNFRTMTHALAEARHEMEAFLYLVSHDLRGPLINIEGFTQRLRATLEEIKRPPHASPSQVSPAGRGAGALHEVTPPPSGPPGRGDWIEWSEREAPQCLDFIQKSVDKIRRLVEGLLKISRLPMRPPEVRRVNLHDMVERILASLRFEISARSVHVEARPLPEVLADELLLSEVFTNLIQNAVQYMGPQPSPRVLISAERQADEWKFAVSDNGIGISPKNLARLFTPFQRFAPDSGRGEGIGLCLVRRFLQRLGGSIWAESKLGGGTTFFFTLPVDPLPQRPALTAPRQEGAPALPPGGPVPFAGTGPEPRIPPAGAEPPSPVGAGASAFIPATPQPGKVRS